MDIVQARQLSRNTRPTRVNDRDFYPFDGGLNLIATPLELKPGELIGCLNYEISTEGGYARVRGFERYDGRTAPSVAPYFLLTFGSAVPANYPAVGVIVNGQTSGATGVVVLAPSVSQLVPQLVLARVTGTFVAGENLRQIASVFGVAAAGASTNGETVDALHEIYVLLAATDARLQIGAVPGSGPVRGVVAYRGVAYAFRDNLAATSAEMYRATAAGWQIIPRYPLLRFDGGTQEILAGATVTGVTSTHASVVKRVVLSKGSWQGGTAEGYLILSPGALAFANNENLQVGGVTKAIANGTAAAPLLQPGGKYEFRVHNFYGHLSTIRLYGVNGVGPAFEFQDGAGSGEFYCPIETGMVDDRPTHLAIHKAYLWMSFSGGSVQKSGVSDPVVFSVITGAGEIGVGDEVTGFLEAISTALFVFCRSKTAVITGAGPDFALDTYAPEVGAIAWSIQRIGQGIFLDDRGFSTLAATNRFGNFSSNSVSANITSLMPEIISRTSCSGLSRKRNLYRLFMDDGRFVSIGYRGDKIVGITTCDLGVPMFCAFNDEDTTGAEFSLLGGTDGFVYRMDSGRNMDGDQVIAFARLPFHFSHTPSRNKKYRLGNLNIRTEGRCSLQIAPEYNYADADTQSDPPKMVQLQGGGGFWNVANWNEFSWSRGPVAGAAVKLEGEGSSIGFLIAHQSINEPPHTLQGMALHYSMRRLKRESIA